MNYRHSPYDFSVDSLPISVGELSRQLRNTHVDIGGLLDFLAPILVRTPGVRSGKFMFSLINVTCAHTGFSYGQAEPPPKAVWPTTATWLYTFAIQDSGYSSDMVPHVAARYINTVVWGREMSEFVTIGTTHSQASEFGLRYDLFTTEKLYYLLGILSKSFVVRNRFYTTAPTYQALYATKALSMLRSQYYMMPLAQMLRNVPLPMLPFNRHVWSVAPTLLSVKHITTESLLYLCQNIRAVGELSKVVETEIIDQFHESLTDLMQRRGKDAQPDLPAEESWQLLYTALAKRDTIPDGDFTTWLRVEESTVELPSGDMNSHIKKLLYA